MSKAIVLNRKDLYKQIWSMPMYKLAAKYNLSGNGLKKICKKLNIPVPPRGFWVKRQYKLKAKVERLPKLRAGEPDSHTLLPINNVIRCSKKMDGVSREAQSLIKSAMEVPTVTVSSQLESPHRLIVKTQNAMKKAKIDECSIITPYRKGCLYISVSPACLDRALRVLDALLKGIEAKGFRILNDKNIYSGPHVKILGETIYFGIVEKKNQVDHVLTTKEIEDKNKYNWPYAPKYDHVPSGDLNLIIRESDTIAGLQKKWADGKIRVVEDILDDFIIGLIRVSDGKIRERIARKERQRRWDEEWRLREEAARLRRLEEERRQDLENQAILWNKSQLLRKFIAAVEKQSEEDSGNVGLPVQIDEWLIWAKQHADRIDPLEN